MKSALLICVGLWVSALLCNGEEHQALIFEKFGWQGNAQAQWFKLTKAKNSASGNFLTDWEGILNHPYYGQSVRDRFAKIIGQSQFRWAIYIDDYSRGEFGSLAGARFMGETVTSQLLLLSKNFRADTHAALLQDSQWKKIAEFVDLEKCTQLSWAAPIELREVEDIPRGQERAITMYFFAKGKTKVVFASSVDESGAVGDKTSKPEGEALSQIRKAVDLISPELLIPILLKASE